MKEPRRKRIVIAESEHGLPYSKGLTASSLMMTGLGPARSYQVANKIEKEMVAGGLEKVSQEQLVDITLEILRREAGDQYAEAFIKWQSVAELDVPLIILIGGATGVGKSTVATQLASRLGITRVVSTDAVARVLTERLHARRCSPRFTRRALKPIKRYGSPFRIRATSSSSASVSRPRLSPWGRSH